MPRASALQLFFSPEGRVGRATFCLSTGLLVGLLAIFEHEVNGLARALLAGPVKLALFVSGVCVLSKRLHDRGRSGWWGAAPLFAFLAVWPWPQGWRGLLGVVVLAVSVFELGLGPGERRFNRFGPPPRLTPRQP